jgi:HTH-type transcriptional regulator/antitoxin HigA
MMMDIRPLRTEEDYDWALTQIEPYFDTVPEPETAAADRFDILADLIAAYEARHHPIEPATPIDLIAAYMQDHGLTQNALAEVVGSVSRASEFLNRKRPLTLAAIQKIAAAWKLPPALLIQPYHLDETAVDNVEA